MSEARPAPRCPICGRPRVHRVRPFCSTTCRDSDLLNWFEGRYGIPVAEDEAESPDGPDDEPPLTPGRGTRSRSR